MTSSSASIVDELKALYTKYNNNNNDDDDDINKNNNQQLSSLEFAQFLDANDELRDFRGEFNIPKHPSDPNTDSIYMCGNSLGLQPKRTQVLLQEELDKWANVGVEGHFHGERPWAHIDEYVVPYMAEVVGAQGSEVAIMNSLSVNLHLLMVSFYRPVSTRYKILMEAHAFCSDHHVVKSQVQLHGYDINDAIICLKPRDGEYTLRTQDILDTIAKNGHDIALIMLPGVQFYTGHAFDMKAITQCGHEYGCNVGFDLAHAVGNIPLWLHDWDVDFAAWCTYKYLNAGPGSIGGIFLHDRHATKSMKELPRFCGWWGQTPTQRFAMEAEWQMLPGAQSFQLSNPAVLPTICLLGSLELFHRAGTKRLQEKSRLLTGYLEYLLLNDNDNDRFIIITPTDTNRRGCQLSILTTKDPIRPIHAILQEKGVICDVREPNVMRIAPTPLYNTFEDVYNFAQLFLDSLNNK